ERRAPPAGRHHGGTGMAATGSTCMTAESTLDLGVIGNGSFGALIDRRARIVWSCMPAFDGDPAFCSLLEPRDHDGGDFSIELEDFVCIEHVFIPVSAVLSTVRHGGNGGVVDVVVFVPRWHWHVRFSRLVTIMRKVTPLSGHKRIRVR